MLSSNHTYFLNAIGSHPDRVERLHLIFAAIATSVHQIKPQLVDASGLNPIEKHLTQELAANLDVENIFNFSFKTQAAVKDLNEKVYSIYQLIDCVSCDKCRLNGKVQIEGLATAFEILFPFEQDIEISNADLVGIIQLLTKLSEAIEIVRRNREDELISVSKVFYGQLVVSIITSAFLTFFITALMCRGHKEFTEVEQEELDDEEALPKSTELIEIVDRTDDIALISGNARKPTGNEETKATKTD